jgi:hypothetical protein
LQEHVRRVLHLAGMSWHAAVVSLVQVGGVLMALALLGSAETHVIWRPFGALTIGTVVALGQVDVDPAATAARIVGQPIFVLAVGLSAVLNPRAMEAGAGRDRAAARHVARPSPCCSQS